MIPSVRFASCYVYSPDGTSDASKRSRLLRALIKAGDPRFMGRYAVRVRQQLDARPCSASPLSGFVGGRYVLVPIPGSMPANGGCQSVPERLALALSDAGVGQGIWRGLRRIHAVRKSATATPGLRPTVGVHYDSLAVDPAGAMPQQVMLIDDVVTKGRTLLAAAARLQDACPSVEIRAFALLRTMGFTRGVQRLLEPCVGEIRWRAGDAQRIP